MPSSPAARRALLPLFSLLSAGLAQAAPLQLTSGAFNSLGPSLSADGSRLAFYSATDPTGGNADHSFEVFVYERAAGQLRQITDHAGGHLTGGHQEPSLSGDGSRVVFQRFSISGGIASFQTQSYDLNTNTLQTLTSPGFFEASAISRDGNTIAVATDNLGLRLFDVATQSFSGAILGNTVGFAMSGDARFFAYENFSQGVRLLDRSTGSTTVVSPNGSGFNQRPALSADGGSLAFVSSFNPLGLNADGNTELFRYDIGTQTLQQITQTGSGAASGASLSGDGTRIAFSSSADLTGGNADGSTEVFVYDLLAGSFLQMTDTLNAFSGDAVLSEDGLTLAYVSNMNLNGANRSGSLQVFMDVLDPQQRLPEPASLALALAALGLLPLSRRARRAAAARG